VPCVSRHEGLAVVVRWSVADGYGILSTMASKKKDGGASRAAGRARVNNKRQEAKYGLQGFTGQVNANLARPRFGTPQEVAVAGAFAGAGRAAPKVGRAVANTGIPNRVINAITRQQVIVHGSPTRGIKTLVPKTPKANPAGTTAVYGMNPSTVNARVGSGPLNLAQIARDYADAGGNLKGSAYIAKVVKSSITNPSSVGSKAKIGIVTAKSPAKVVKEIPMAGKTEAQLQSEILRSAKRAGAKIPKSSKGTKRK